MELIGFILIIVVLGLYGLWLWSTRRRAGAVAKDQNGVQTFDIVVKGAYAPSVVTARVNQPVRINFNRQESEVCSRYVAFSDFKIRKELPENQITAVEFTPTKPGRYLFTCDMGMYQGTLVVE